MSKIIYALYLPLVFPEGLAPGNGSDSNRLLIARNGASQPVLRGTALAGVLRHTWHAILKKSQETKAAEAFEKSFFGASCEEETEAELTTASRLNVPDSILFSHQASAKDRTHHQRNRHTGTVLQNALFSLEACPPLTETNLLLWLEGKNTEEEKAKDLAFLKQTASFFLPESGGLLLGGSSARGIGRVLLKSGRGPAWKAFDLSSPEACGEYLDFRQVMNPDSETLDAICASWETCECIGAGNSENLPFSNRLTVSFTLKIPRGQDILVSDGDMKPQRICDAKGKMCWRLPGSTFRGLFRRWVTRLAARAGEMVADSHQNYVNSMKDSSISYSGDSLAWAFMKDLAQKNSAAAVKNIQKEYPVEDLFGTAFKHGRIHFTDAFTPCKEPQDGTKETFFSEEEQVRTHVKIDPITGGVFGGALFENTVLTSAKNPQFTVTLFVEEPKEQEVRWLSSTLKALDFGLLRVGTSKAAGRLALAETPKAVGPFAELFTSIKPLEFEE